MDCSKLFVHNKKMDANFHMMVNHPKKSKSSLGQRLINIIVDNGQTEKGIFKGYFFCIYEKGQFLIHPAIQPEENW